MKQEIIETIKKVISIEIDTLFDIKNNINDNFYYALDLIYKSSGKVVFIGVGKSGIIAKKIVATLISTGTKAIFLHPVEAIHGDLGILDEKDIVIILSKSGNSPEIISIIPYIKKIKLPIISMTSNKTSILAKQSDIILYLPVKKEACPIGLAPTSSTTAMLVIGDALAASLIKIKNFTKDDFAKFHPGGELGKKLLLKVNDIMRQGEKNSYIYIDSTIEDMFSTINQKMIGSVAVISKNNDLLGIITDYDIRKIFRDRKDIYKITIEEIMNKKPIFVYKDDLAYQALDFMEKRPKPISVLAVLDKETKKFVGMLHIHDILG